MPGRRPRRRGRPGGPGSIDRSDRKSTRLNSSHLGISYAVFCLKKKKNKRHHSYVLQKQHTHHLAPVRRVELTSLSDHARAAQWRRHDADDDEHDYGMMRAV